MLDYAGKTVWITGASSGIGEALARAFAKRGAKLLLSARRVDRLEQVARACAPDAGEVQVLPLDMADFAGLPDKAREAARLIGPIDVMVHNAGVGQRGSVLETTFEVERRMLETNYLGPVALTKALLPEMVARGQGTFVVMSSVLGLMSVKHRAGYSASKHALHGYFNGLRAELTEKGIHVLLVCPGHVNTEFSLHAMEADGRAHGVVDAGQENGLTPADCAARTLAALDRDKHEIYVAKWESLGVYLNRYAPGLLRSALARAKAR
ncbi:MAG: SDR family oxidoreductase [Myxococcales bacterium]